VNADIYAIRAAWSYWMHRTGPVSDMRYPVVLDGPLTWHRAVALYIATHRGYLRWKPGRGEPRIGRCRRWRYEIAPTMPPVSAWPVVARRALILRMREQGMTSDAIGEAIGMTGRGVRYVLSRDGATPDFAEVVTRCHDSGVTDGEERAAG
jgi:hypothetical protein